MPVRHSTRVRTLTAKAQAIQDAIADEAASKASPVGIRKAQREGLARLRRAHNIQVQRRATEARNLFTADADRLAHSGPWVDGQRALTQQETNSAIEADTQDVAGSA